MKDDDIEKKIRKLDSLRIILTEEISNLKVELSKKNKKELFGNLIKFIKKDCDVATEYFCVARSNNIYHFIKISEPTEKTRNYKYTLVRPLFINVRDNQVRITENDPLDSFNMVVESAPRIHINSVDDNKYFGDLLLALYDRGYLKKGK